MSFSHWSPYSALNLTKFLPLQFAGCVFSRACKSSAKNMEQRWWWALKLVCKNFLPPTHDAVASSLHVCQNLLLCSKPLTNGHQKHQARQLGFVHQWCWAYKAHHRICTHAPHMLLELPAPNVSQNLLGLVQCPFSLHHRKIESTARILSKTSSMQEANANIINLMHNLKPLNPDPVGGPAVIRVRSGCFFLPEHI